MIRRFCTSLLTVGALVLLAAFTSQAELRPMLTHHVREVTRNGQARLVGHLPANQSMRLVMVLPLRNQAALDKFLSDVNDPFSSSFHHYLTVEQFTQKFGPTQSDYDTAIAFAKTNGFKVTGTSVNRVNLSVTGTVSKIEAAFHVTMNVYQHPTENRTFFAPDREPTADVQLWHVTGLDNYSIPKPMLQRRDVDPLAHPPATTGSCPGKSFCGSDMRAAYYEGTTLTGSGQYVGLLEYEGTDLADLNTYYKNAGQTNNVPVTLLSVDGTSTSCLASQGCDDTEQTIDMTQALGMAPGLVGLTEYIGSTDSALLNAMATGGGGPLMYNLSSSWVWRPADASTDDPYYEEMESQGQTMFQASGDSGKWSKSQEYTWPSDNQYVISTGGTDLTTTGAGGPWASETGWADSGGGISPNSVAIPSWQVATAAGCSSCSQTLRNGPDISANANYTFYVCADQTTCSENEYGGTSFAAPMWAAYIALTNQQAGQNGNPPVGFINPTLYTLGLSSSYNTDFHDITSGSNGFQATVGYDLVTGWGSPNGANLIVALAGSGSSGSFTLSASPNKIRIAQGTSAKSTITSTTTGGFDSAVTLSSNVNIVFFSPNPIPAPGSGTSTAFIKVSKSTPLGPHTLKITGTGGGVTASTTITIDVTQ